METLSNAAIKKSSKERVNQLGLWLQLYIFIYLVVLWVDHLQDGQKSLSSVHIVNMANFALFSTAHIKGTWMSIKQGPFSGKLQQPLQSIIPRENKCDIISISFWCFWMIFHFIMPMFFFSQTRKILIIHPHQVLWIGRWTNDEWVSSNGHSLSLLLFMKKLNFQKKFNL